ncbi:hypothetical protein M427DRAFT_51318 [Gonapodya prolifera JEL478]|uniref:BAG domain-containing protein n=1 Tax=Gonapodya prolifera (strain JEL478) TaxID=1344416 RepID=A0A139AZ06_GONPJ|nr:hypothetical protein M427DRAFT_51318 [Gonapodya prolifera JEL478]|eukprot:KXS21947.1 hypothetical protein M427DRAFT_51318 [Gonapodya prolifera JEL478]
MNRRRYTEDDDDIGIVDVQTGVFPGWSPRRQVPMNTYEPPPSRRPPPLPPYAVSSTIPPEVRAILDAIHTDLALIVRDRLPAILAMNRLELSSRGDVLPSATNRPYLAIVDALERLQLRLDAVEGAGEIRDRRRTLIREVNRVLASLDTMKARFAKLELDRVVEVSFRNWGRLPL